MFFISSCYEHMLPTLFTIWHYWHIFTIVFTSFVLLCQKYLRQILTRVLCSPKCPKSLCIWITSAILLLWFGHKQTLEVKPLLLPTIIDYSLSGLLVFLKIHCVWSYAFFQQSHANCVLPYVNVLCVHPTCFLFIRVCMT
jgi:hypothetical protein